MPHYYEYGKNSELAYAIKENDIDKFKALLANKDIDVNARFHGETPLILAIKLNKTNIPLFPLLLLNHPNIDPNAPNEGEKAFCDGHRADTPLICAIKKGQIETVKALLMKKNIDVNLKDKGEELRDCHVPLFYALESNNEEIIEALIFAGANISALNWLYSLDNTPIYMIQHAMKKILKKQFKEMLNPTIDLNEFKKRLEKVNLLTLHLNQDIFKKYRAKIRGFFITSMLAQKKAEPSADLLQKLKHLKEHFDLIKPNDKERKNGTEKTAMEKLMECIAELENPPASKNMPNWESLFKLELNPEQAQAALADLNQKLMPSKMDHQERKIARGIIVDLINETHDKLTPETETPFLENLLTRINLIKENLSIIQPNEKETKNNQEKTAMRELKSLEQRVSAWLTESKNPVALVKVAGAILTSDNKELDPHIDALLNSSMEENGLFQCQLSSYLRSLKNEALTQLQEKLKNIVLASDGFRVREVVQNNIRNLLLNTQVPYEKNPFLFILRFNKTSPAQKNTSTFKAINDKLGPKKPGLFSKLTSKVNQVKILPPAKKGPTLSRKEDDKDL